MLMPMHALFNRLALGALLLAAPALAGESPVILKRAEWKAAAPSLAMTKHAPVAILVHHTGSPQKLKVTLAAKMKGLQRFSQAREKLADGRTKPAWPDVPYHYYIAANGQIAEGRDVNAVGDTNTGYDPKGFIQVVLEGNFDSEKVTAEQEVSLTQLLSMLSNRHKINKANILTHKDKAQTACPGADLSKKLPDIIAAIK
jgi:N-acetylmuramoyl-L-alanine amidase